MPSIQLDQVSQAYESRPVLRDLSLKIERGLYTVLLGPSGCGKTTLLRIIAGLQEPDHGDVLFDAESVNHLAPRKRDVSLVAQRDGLYPHRTIAQSIRMASRRTDGKSRETNIARAIQLGRTQSLLDRYPNRLSGGELRRAAIAMAVARDAAVRLLDEPLSALDTHVRQSLQDDLLNWHQESPGTTVHVTHDGQEALRMADRIAVMEDGKIIQHGTPDEIFQQPVSLTVAQSIGIPPINLFSGAVRAGKLACQALKFDSDWPIHSPDRDIIIGVRSEHFTIAKPDHDCFAVTVLPKKSIPWAGRRQWRVTADEKSIYALTETDSALAAGKPTKLFADRQHVLLFDAQTKRRIAIS